MPSPKLVIDLERMSQLPKDKVGPLARYVATIQSQRGDYNGRVLSVRHEDLRSLAVIYDKSPADLAEELISWGVLTPTRVARWKGSEPLACRPKRERRLHLDAECSLRQ